MPQMSPLMWGLLFLIFSTLIILTTVHTYFSSYSAYEGSASLPQTSTLLMLTWMW